MDDVYKHKQGKTKGNKDKKHAKSTHASKAQMQQQIEKTGRSPAHKCGQQEEKVERFKRECDSRSKSLVLILRTKRNDFPVWAACAVISPTSDRYI